ncbi:sulfotransferase [Spongiactinospora sp. TRM90649]|uniref:sulfotransferase n=1 Tax=Spongiactinospora sp. TRM90649 TaxID=3031114 RepID=UPI0023F7BD93|nr:sulfotransferase [Spongiactinospora sp. TRM90649]MDF5757688.1 sulfotransferase [Spongiactinospora sp. TRM90649]
MSPGAPVVLLGAQRSGTTALAHALSRAYADAGGLFTVNGKLPYLLPRWCTRADLDGRHLRADEITFALSRRPPGGEGAGLWTARVAETLRHAAARVAEGEPADPRELIADIVAESYAGWPFWGDKYNEYLLDLPALLAAVPTARLVLLVRDPGEVAASVLAWTGDRPYRPATLRGAYAKWAAWHRGWLDLAPTLDPARRLVIGYRELCAGRETARLSDFTGLDLVPYLGGLRASRRHPGAPPPDPQITAVWRSVREMEHVR